MDLMQQFDIYCERLGPEFWAEPWNAITNASFLICAVIAIIAAVREDKFDWPVGLLAALTTIIGIGSFLFHTFATGWALLADVIPIQLFIVAYFVLAMRRFAGLNWLFTLLATAVFLAWSFIGGGMIGDAVGDALNGSEGYIPPLSGLIVVGLILLTTGRTGSGWSLVAGAGLFFVSLTFRTFDMAVCDAFPTGIHFLWHSLNGMLLGFLTYALARYGVPRGARAA